MKFEDIARANESIRTTAIKGKEYAEVNQRIKAFRMCYPQGFILTEIDSLKDGVCVMTARVGFYVNDKELVILGEGHAYEKEGSSSINKTSFIENCETSAVGRALGMAGFGIDTSVASAEEVQNAILNQGKEEEPSVGPNEVGALIRICNETGTSVESMCKYYNHSAIPEFSYTEWLQAMDFLTRRKEKQSNGSGDNK